MNFPYLIWNMLYKIFSFLRQCLHIRFQLCDNCICIPIIASEIFQRKSSILLVILSNPQFYHTYVRWKFSVLSQNMSSSFFNCICMPIFVSEFSFSKIFKFKIYVILNFIIHVRWKSCFIQKCLHLLFQLYSNRICMSTITSEIFLNESSILSIILCNSQFHHTCAR